MFHFGRLCSVAMLYIKDVRTKGERRTVIIIIIIIIIVSLSLSLRTKIYIVVFPLRTEGLKEILFI